MNYAPRNNVTPNFQSSRAKTGMSLPVKIVAVLVIILAIFYTFLPHVVPAFFLSLVSPIWRTDGATALKETTLEELQTTYALMASTTLENNALQHENDDLKALMGRTSIQKPILATVMKRPPYTAYDSLIIDVAFGEGVEHGDRVYALGDIPIGEIEEIIGTTARVKLYSTYGNQFTVLIGPSNIESAAIGKGGGYFEASLPRDTKIKTGDEVHIPTLSNSFVGTVDGIASEPSEPFAKILFHQPVNIYEQRWVLVDTNDAKQ